jgi:hypothetical protein
VKVLTAKKRAIKSLSLLRTGLTLTPRSSSSLSTISTYTKPCNYIELWVSHDHETVKLKRDKDEVKNLEENCAKTVQPNVEPVKTQK